MKYQICNSTDKKHLAEMFEAETVIEIVTLVSARFNSDFDVSRLTSHKLIIRDSHETVVLKQIN